jgi:hypothetical protein
MTAKSRKQNWHLKFSHGVLGSMLLKDLDFKDNVVSAVATHATDSPFHASTREGYILNYADFFAADHALILESKVPYYQKKI